jgi:YidC/Oxa1 family membrane protein insertase
MIFANVIQSAFGPLITVFKAVLVEAHALLGGSWGWSIIALTIVIRLVTLPLMIRQFRSMAVMQAHQPELKAIQQRYKDDKQRQSEEMMKYYREHGVNPFAACLPLLIQLPVLISLFYMLRTDLKEKICGPAIKAAHITTKELGKVGCSSLAGAHGSASFLFIHDITVKATGVTLIVLIGLYLATMLMTSYFSTLNVDRSQRIMYMLLPLVFTIVIVQYPAGLLLYWTTSNMTQIPLQWYARRQVPKVAVPTAAGKTPSTGSNGRAPAPDARRAVGAVKPTRTTPPPQAPRKRKRRSGRRR